MRVAYIHTHMIIDQSASVATGPNIAFVSVIIPSSTQRRDHGEHLQYEQAQRVEREDGEAHRDAVHRRLPQAVDDPKPDIGPGGPDRVAELPARKGPEEDQRPEEGR